ncbi:MAG TPA: TonB-dependent receptor [Steroidobacteraceae bacterium]|nr:TonB-dependent receptor [Steroidobacteraceae bacterium]
MTTTLRSRMNLVQRIAIGGAALFATCGVLQAATSDVVEEIVVTAQKREQSVQDVPIAITAFTAETLQTKGVADIGALTRLTPNVNLDTGSPFSGDTSVLSASIRGIGQDDFAFNLDPGVGVYLDGVYLARTIGANQSLLDIDRIEILKGPQGTLFGRNSIGGAISIVTHTPGSEPRFIATATTGSYSRRDLSATADIPLSESFLTSISFSSQVRDGYQKVIPYPNTTEMGNVPYFVDDQTAFPKAGYATSDTKGGQNLQVIRGKALWKASDAVNVTFAADYSHQNQSSYPTTVLDVTTVPQGYGGLGALYNLCISVPAAVLDDPDGPFGRTAQGMPTPGPGPFNTSPTGVCGIRGSHPTATGLPPLAPGGAPLGGAGYVGGPDPYGSPANPSSAAPRIYWNMANTQTGDIDTTYANGPSFAKYDAWGSSATVDWSLSDSMSFKSITGWRYIDWKVGVDLDGMPESIQEVTDHQSQDQFSQEFQLTGKAFDSKLDYVAGLYYFQEEGFVHDFVPFGGSLYIYDVANDVDTKSYAAFFHTDYNFNDSFGITLGARYSKDDKTFEGGQSDLDGFTYKISGCYDPAGSANALLSPFIPVGVTCQQALGFTTPGQPDRYFPAGDQKQSYTVFTPTIGAQWHVNSDAMLYLSFSKGFKAGGWTTRLSAPIPDITDAAFGPEFAKTYELGFKSEFFDRHLQTNIAAFYSDYTGIQLNFQEGPSPVLRNAGDATIKGVELEMQAVIGGGFSINFAGGYMDASYDSIDPAVTIANPGFTTANKLPKTPEYKFTISPQYDITLSNTGRIRLGVDYTRTASMFNDAPNVALLFRPATDNLTAAIHYLAPSEKYELTLGGTNLTDDRYLTVGSVNGGQGETVGTYNPPRQWYLSLRMKFE